jgi:hypothetical protein
MIWWCLFSNFAESIGIDDVRRVEQVVKYLLSSETLVADFKIILPEIIVVR